MAPEAGPPADKLILIADDDPEILKYLEIVIKKEGFQVETASEGEEALRKAQKTRPHLILLDLKLPKLQGLEILRLLQSGDTADIPVFIITGHIAHRETERMVKQEANVKGYYTKPVNPTLLAMNVHALLGTRPATQGKPLGW
ncbi:MAG: response regulator [Elusimicrobia bacterium]|nr:response regulator [Elusimicrobiota bacterium]